MSQHSPAFSMTDAPSAEMLLAVDAGLDQYNHAVAPLSDARQLAVVATEASGRVIGGAVGRTWGSCCELLQLWVVDEVRSRGVGSRLLREFELHARTRGCSVFYLTTLSFQAPGFYRRHGYDVLAEIGGHGNGIVKYLMQKTEA